MSEEKSQDVEKPQPQPKVGNVIKSAVHRLELSDGNVYELRPLKLRALKGLAPNINRLVKLTESDEFEVTTEFLDELLKIIHVAFQRTHPDLKVEDLDDLVDFEMAMTILSSVVGPQAEGITDAKN